MLLLKTGSVLVIEIRVLDNASTSEISGVDARQNISDASA